MPTPDKIVDFRLLTVIAQEPEGRTYEYEAYLLPGDEVLVPAETSASSFWGSKEEVQPFGLDQILEIREPGGLSRWTMAEITEAVQQSAREFGEDAIPESLKFLLAEDDEVARAWGAEVDRIVSDPAQMQNTYPWEEVKAMVFKA